MDDQARFSPSEYANSPSATSASLGSDDRRPTEDGTITPDTALPRQFAMTIFPNNHAQSARRVTGTVEEIVGAIGLKAPPEFAAKGEMPMLSFAEYGHVPTARGSLRHTANLQKVHGVIGDYDDGRITIDRACALLRALNVKAVLYSSASSTAAAPRWRVLVPLSKPINSDRYAAVLERLDAIFGWTLDPSSYKAVQGFYFGRVRGAQYEYQYLETGGERYLDEIEGGLDPSPERRPKMFPRDSEMPVEAIDDRVMADVEEAVMALPEPFWRDYGPWMKVALALKSLVPAGQGQRALALWHRFSEQDRRYDHAEARRKWDSAEPAAITHHSIFKWARDEGWAGPHVAPRRRFNVIPANEYAEGAPLEWIIKGVLPKAGLGVIYGASGSGKSFMILDMLASIAEGIPWRGFRVNKARVIYVAAEGAAGLRRRTQALTRERKISVENIGVIADAPNLLADEDAEGLVDALCRFKGDLIVIDTLAQAMPGGDENSSKDMGGLLERARRIHDRTGGMVLLIHHAGKDAARGARGWSGLRAAADFEAEVTRDGEARVLKLTKLKDGNDGLSFGFRLKQVDLGRDDDGDPLSSCVIEHVDVVPSRPKLPTGKRQRAVYKVAMELTQNGKVAAARIIEQVVSLMPLEPGTRDRRPEIARRALDELSLGGWLKADGELIGHDF